MCPEGIFFTIIVTEKRKAKNNSLVKKHDTTEADFVVELLETPRRTV